MEEEPELLIQLPSEDESKMNDKTNKEKIIFKIYLRKLEI